MDVPEHEAKLQLADHGVAVPAGTLVRSVDDACRAARQLGLPVMVKAQIAAGGRGNAGGVVRANSVDEVGAAADRLLGSRLQTSQTGDDGLLVSALRVEHACRIAREWFLAFAFDRQRARLELLVSPVGGTAVEQQADALLRLPLRLDAALAPALVRQAAAHLAVPAAQESAFSCLLQDLWRFFCQRDCLLLEINPLALTAGGALLVLDVKLTIDDDALFRQRSLPGRGTGCGSAAEAEARAAGLQYVALDGTVGCLVNGAGLAMATMDSICLAGGRPANFLDVGGGASAEKVARAFSLLMADAGVRVVLVNIFGGILRCDRVARGIIAAAERVALRVPVVVRLAGTSADAGRRLLDASGLDLTVVEDFAAAAQTAVALAAAGSCGSGDPD